MLRDIFFPLSMAMSPISTNMPSVSGMHTDIKETDAGYEYAMDLPGYQKENISISIKNGRMVVATNAENSKDEKDEDGRYIRRERLSNSCSRSFYVGTEVTEDDIKASFRDGVLNITVAKKEKAKIEEEKMILIE